MAFLDNSGDIILDAVLTDTGRMRLARGDGSFRVAKFALGDDEIDYSLFHNSNHESGQSHPSGSAYYDLEIMQTPVLEAFTNNTSCLKHKLISLPQTNLMYLPVLKLNNINVINQPVTISSTSNGTWNNAGTDENVNDAVFLLAADETTAKQIPNGTNFLNGVNDVTDQTESFIAVDQGLDTSAVSLLADLSPELIETQYIIRSDYRFLRILPSTGGSVYARESFVDDDQIASYYLSKNTDSEYITSLSRSSESDTNAVLQGPPGTRIKFGLRSSMDISTSKFLFETINGGSTITHSTHNSATNNQEYYYIDTNIRVSGATTGYSMDIPVRILKLKTT